jgi:hypothetical protein
METAAPEALVTLDPLIAEAKRRARRRNVAVALSVLLVVAAALAATFALGPSRHPVSVASRGAGSHASTPITPSHLTNLRHDNPDVVPVGYSARYGWSPAVPRSASTPAKIVSTITASAGFGKAVTVSVSTGAWVALAFHIPTDGTVAGNIYAAWKADLLEGVIAEAFVKRHMPRVDTSSITGELPNGTTVSLQGGMGDIPASQRFSSDSDAAIEHDLTGALSAAHLTPVSITVMHAGQPAPAVVVSSTDPHAAVSAATSLIRSLFFADGRPLYEGYYLKIETAAGAPVAAYSASFRTGAGRQWASPSIAPCAGDGLSSSC